MKVVMKIYSHHGFDDFVICAGYKGYASYRYDSKIEEVTISRTPLSSRVAIPGDDS